MRFGATPSGHPVGRGLRRFFDSSSTIEIVDRREDEEKVGHGEMPEKKLAIGRFNEGLEGN